MSLKRIRLAKRLKSFKRLPLIPRFCDFGISSTFDAVLRYLPIFLRYYGICRYFLRYCGVQHPPMSPSYKVSIEIQRCGRLNRSILRDHLVYVIEQSSIHAGMIAAVASIVPKFSSTFSISRPDHLCTVSCDRGDYMETRLKETTIGWANSCSTLNVPGRAPYLKSWK